MAAQARLFISSYGTAPRLMPPRLRTVAHLFTSLLGVAFACLFIADTWAAVLLFTPPHTHRSGSPPDLFWSIFYLLLPLAGLVRLRLAPAEISPRPRGPSEGLGCRDPCHGTQFLLPGVPALGTSAVIIVNALLTN